MKVHYNYDYHMYLDNYNLQFFFRFSEVYRIKQLL